MRFRLVRFKVMRFRASSKIFSARYAMASMLCCVLATPSFAQGPDAGALWREHEIDWGDPEQWRAAPPLQLEARDTEYPGADIAIRLTKFTIEGATLIPEPQLQAKIAGFLSRDATVADLHRAADALANHYRAKGLLARVYLPEQVIDNGSILLRVVEARAADSRFEVAEGNRRVPRVYAERVVAAHQPIGEAVQLDDITRAAAILENTPGIRSSVLLQPGERQGETRVLTRLQGQPLLNGRFTADNFGSRSTGEDRGGLDLAFASPTGRGDVLSLGVNSSGDNHFARVGYSLPVGVSGLRIGGHLSWLDYGLGGEFSALDAQGNALTLGLDFSYPMLLSNPHNLRLTGGIEQRRYEDQRLGEDISDRSVSSASIGLVGDVRDELGQGGVTLYSVSLVAGNADLRNAAEKAADQASAGRDGSFAKVVWRLSRLQFLAPRHSLWLNLNGQVASTNLDSSEQTGLSGPGRVRAYPSLEGSGDEALVFTAEWRYRISDPVLLKVFYDHGLVTQHRDTWDGWNAGSPDVDNRYELKGAGFGANFYLPAQITARADAAWRIGDNPAGNPVTGKDADGTLRKPRVWISVSKDF